VSAVPTSLELGLGGVEVLLETLGALSAFEACSRVVEETNVLGESLRGRLRFRVLAPRALGALAGLAGTGRLSLSRLRLERGLARVRGGVTGLMAHRGAAEEDSAQQRFIQLREAGAEIDPGAAFEMIEDGGVEVGGVVHGDLGGVVNAEAEEQEDMSSDRREVHEASCQVAEPEHVGVGEEASEVAPHVL
jgi:hypothetical protein